MPGIDIRQGTILVDEARLAHPGDLLHEAGHLAVADPAERGGARLSPSDGDEMAAIAWSWAALKHLDLDPAIVFHAHLPGRFAILHREFFSRAHVRSAAPAVLRNDLRVAKNRRERGGAVSPYAALAALTA